MHLLKDTLSEVERGDKHCLKYIVSVKDEVC